MSGRHHKSGLLRRFLASTTGRVATTMIVVGAVLAVTWTGVRAEEGPECTGTTRLSVAAAPEIAPAVRTAAGSLTSPDFCVSVDVAPADPYAVASAALAEGSAAGRSAPDVWIPDSSTWLQRIRTIAPGKLPASAPPIARSPVVLAVPSPVATRLGWLDRPPKWFAHRFIVAPRRWSRAIGPAP